MIAPDCKTLCTERYCEVLYGLYVGETFGINAKGIKLTASTFCARCVTPIGWPLTPQFVDILNVTNTNSFM